MKKLFLGLVLSLSSFFWFLVPMQVEAGCGLRVDVPYGRIDCFDSGGRWSDDPRRFDPHFNGTYGYGGSVPYSGSAYSRGGTTIINPAPGTSLKVRKKEGGFLCSLLNFCSEERVDFSTAPKEENEKALP